MDIKEREIDDLFYKYGRIRDIDLKTPSRPPAYAFVSFDDERDAEDAIRARDGYTYDGYRLRVEFARGSRDVRRDERRRPAGRRTEHRVIVTGLPRSASWQDLKDHMRKAGDVIYADVDHNGEGVVEFSNREDMEAAVRKLDDTEFKNPFDKSYIRVKFANKESRDRKSRSRSGSPKGRSISRDRGGKDRKNDRRRSSSISNSRSRSRSRSRSPSPKRSSRKIDDEDDEDDDDRKPRKRTEDSDDDVVVTRESPRVDREEDGSDADLNNDD